jgi:hypothetical protein
MNKKISKYYYNKLSKKYNVVWYYMSSVIMHTNDGKIWQKQNINDLESFFQQASNNIILLCPSNTFEKIRGTIIPLNYLYE